MATPPKKTPDRHYDFRRMNVWFAWTSLALLGVTVWMVWADYAKPWKRLQAEFRELERQTLLGEAQQERQQLSENEVAQLQQDIAGEEQALAAQRGEIGELESERDRLGRRALCRRCRVPGGQVAARHRPLRLRPGGPGRR